MFWNATQSNIYLLRKSKISQVYLACKSKKDKKTAFNFLKSFNNKKSKPLFINFLMVKVWSRSSHILPSFIGKFFIVHSGQFFLSLFVQSFMVGYRFGDFVLTKKSKMFKK